MIQKILISFFVIIIFIYGIRFLKKVRNINNSINNKEEEIVDLEKDPITNEYKPKE
jgi:hypothetical protein